MLLNANYDQCYRNTNIKCYRNTNINSIFYKFIELNNIRVTEDIQPAQTLKSVVRTIMVDERLKSLMLLRFKKDNSSEQLNSKNYVKKWSCVQNRRMKIK